MKTEKQTARGIALEVVSEIKEMTFDEYDQLKEAIEYKLEQEAEWCIEKWTKNHIFKITKKRESKSILIEILTIKKIEI